MNDNERRALVESEESSGGFTPNYFCEASLSRLVGFVYERAFAILTAFKKIYPRPKNRKRNRELLTWLDSNGMGPHWLKGYWTEIPEGMTYDQAAAAGLLGESSSEDSFFVPRPQDMPEEEFRAKMIEAMKEWEQQAIIYGTDDQKYGLVFDDGSETLFAQGKLTINQLGQAYSRMKGTHIPFKFEGVAQPINSISCMAFRMTGLRWLGRQGDPVG